MEVALSFHRQPDEVYTCLDEVLRGIWEAVPSVILSVAVVGSALPPHGNFLRF